MLSNYFHQEEKPPETVEVSGVSAWSSLIWGLWNYKESAPTRNSPTYHCITPDGGCPLQRSPLIVTDRGQKPARGTGCALIRRRMTPTVVIVSK